MRIYQHLTASEVQLEPFPFKRELSMESYLIENEGVLTLDNSNYSDVTIIQEELTLKQGRSSKDTDGRIDILVTYNNEHIGIIELKLGELNQIHLDQLKDYLQKKEQILEQFPDIYDPNITPKPKWIGVLVGSSIDPQLAAKIKKGCDTQCDTLIAALTIQRFTSNDGQIYIITDVHMPEVKQVRDTTQYMFKGKTLNKGRLVLEVVTSYAEDHPNMSFSQLKSIFPNKIQGSHGIFSTVSEAEKIYNSTGRKRHFIKPNEIITLCDEKIAICSQWGIGNIDKFIQIAKKQGYIIEKY